MSSCFGPLLDHLHSAGFTDSEAPPLQVELFVKNLAAGKSRILEIGAGYSTFLFLRGLGLGGASVTLTSIDYQRTPWLNAVLDCIGDESRHTFIEQNSAEALAGAADTEPFDLIVLDGSTEFGYAYADLVNCAQKYAHEDTVFLMSNVNVDHLYGPSAAWNEAVQNGIIKETRRGGYIDRTFVTGSL